MADRRGCRLLNRCMFPEPEIKESIIETESFSSTLSPVFSLFFFSETLSSVSAPDFLLFLPSHPVIGASGTSRQDVSALRDAGVPSLTAETEKLLSA